MTRIRIILRIDTDELGDWPDKVIGSLIKAATFAAEHHPTEIGILSLYAENFASLLFIPLTGHDRPNPRYEIHTGGVTNTKISIVSPQEN